jgi:N6-adenosine-specific RNA methylase IME4
MILWIESAKNPGKFFCADAKLTVVKEDDPKMTLIVAGRVVRGVKRGMAGHKFLPDGLRVMEAWGFRYINKVVWIKENHVGLGQYFRGKTEDCLFGVRGVLPYRITDEGKRAQGMTAIYAKPTRHSEKPEEMRDVIELVSHGPRIELFARSSRSGWDVWGNEIDSTIKLQTT